MWPRSRRNQNKRKTGLAIQPTIRRRPLAPTLREANLGDYQQIVAVQSRNGIGSRARENWLAFWRENPVYKRREGKWPIGWVLENSENDIVGYIGNLPSIYHFRGAKLLSSSPSPWVVDESYRRYSTTLLDCFTRQKDVDLLINSTVGKLGAVSRLFGFLKVPVGTWDKSAFWITTYRGFLRVTLSSKAGSLARGLTYPLAAALFFRDCFKIDRGHISTSAPELELCPTFDSRFDEFWEDLKQQRSSVLLAERTQETLLWHFRDKLAQGRVWILTAYKDSRLVAYTILDLDDNALGLRRVRLVDFQTLRGFEDTIYRFLARAIDQCRREGIHLLEVTGCWLDRPGLPKVVPPYHRRLPSWVFRYKAFNPELSSALREPAAWAPSSFDGDASM